MKDQRTQKTEIKIIALFGGGGAFRFPKLFYVETQNFLEATLTNEEDGSGKKKFQNF